MDNKSVDKKSLVTPFMIGVALMLIGRMGLNGWIGRICILAGALILAVTGYTFLIAEKINKKETGIEELARKIKESKSIIEQEIKKKEQEIKRLKESVE